MVYPVSAYLYNGTSWGPVEAQIYQDGEWLEFEKVLLLYENGTFQNANIIPILNYGCKFNDDHILVPYYPVTTVYGIYTQTPPPEGFSTVHMLVSSDIGGDYTVMGQYGQNELTASLPSIVKTGAGRVSYVSQAISGTKMEIIIQMTGPYGFFIGDADTQRSLKVYKIWLT